MRQNSWNISESSLAVRVDTKAKDENDGMEMAVEVVLSLFPGALQQQLQRPESARVNWRDQLIPISSSDAISAYVGWWRCGGAPRGLSSSRSCCALLHPTADLSPETEKTCSVARHCFLTFSLLSHERYPIGATRRAPLRASEDDARRAGCGHKLPEATGGYRSYVLEQRSCSFPSGNTRARFRAMRRAIC